MNSISTKVTARMMPRDATNVMVGLFVALPLQIVPIFIVPPIVGFFVGRAFGWGFLPSFVFAFVILLIIYFTWLAFAVWSLRLSDSGIQFVRLLGRPKFLRWDEITDVAETPRREVVLQGWIAPRFPAREMTPSLSALRHFRIRWGTDYCYYPPDDVESFVKLIDEFRTKQTA